MGVSKYFPFQLCYLYPPAELSKNQLLRLLANFIVASLAVGFKNPLTLRQINYGMW